MLCLNPFKIVGNTGKQLIEEIPLDQTQPPYGRVQYVAHGQTSNLLASATQRVAEVIFQPTTGNLAYHYEPGPAATHVQQPQYFAEPSPNVPQQSSFSQRQPGGLPPGPEPHSAGGYPGMPGGGGGDGQFSRAYTEEFGQYPGQEASYHSQSLSSAAGSEFDRPYPRRMDSRFATLPNNNSSRPDLPDLPSHNGPTLPPKDSVGGGGPTNANPRDSVRRSASGISESGADLFLAYYQGQEGLEEEPAAPGRNNLAPTTSTPMAKVPSNVSEEDPYASDGSHAFSTRRSIL